MCRCVAVGTQPVWWDHTRAMPQEMTTTMDYTAHELLHKILEFHRMTPERAEWSLEAQRENPPRLVRLRQIAALLRAFLGEGDGATDVGARIGSFLEGSFVLRRRLEDFAGILAEIDVTMATRARHVPKRPLELEDLHANFTILVQLRLKLEEAVKHNDGVLEVGYTRCYPVLLAQSVARELATPIEELDRVLALFIAPADRCFSEADLIARFGFPTEDLGEIDYAWF